MLQHLRTVSFRRFAYTAQRLPLGLVFFVGAGGTHASPPSGVPGWEGGHKKHKPKGQSLCGIRVSLKTHSSEML